MQPGVPFALLGTALLLAVAAHAGLAAAVLARPAGTRRTRPAALLVLAGALVLSGAEAATATGTDPSSDAIALARAAGSLLLAAGLLSGALAGVGRPALRAPGPTALPAVVVPLGAAPPAAAISAAAAAAAGLAALRARRDAVGVLVAVGLALDALPAALAPAARDSRTAALALVSAHALAAVLVLGGLLALARTSLLAKVVSAILAGVLVMAAAAVGVVGTTVVRGYQREQAAVVDDAASGRQELLQQSLDRMRVLTPVLAQVCRGAGFVPAPCTSGAQQLTEPTAEDFLLLVPRTGDPVLLGGRAPLAPAEALGLAGSDLVRQVAAGGASAARTAVGRPERLSGATPGLALVVALPVARATPDAPADVFVYGVRVGRSLVDADIVDGGFGFTLLAGDTVVASNLPPADLARVTAVARRTSAVPPAGTTVAAVGDSPTVHLGPLTSASSPSVGVIALSRSAADSLQEQRRALTDLLLTALATTAVVAALAVVVGRRTVEPVRRLTLAAQRVSAGDLDVRTGVGGRDEVGTLARAFDTMTGSLGQVTGDLRSTADRLETVLASMSDGLLASDGDGVVTSANRAALALTGLEADVVGRPLADVLDARDEVGAPVPLAAGLERAVDVQRADGTPVPVRVAVAPLDGGAGLVVVLRDTTQEREVERMKTEFLSNVSHELRTPLTPIRGYADLLANRPGLTPQQVGSFAGTILSEALKMNRVVDLLVDVAAIEAGRVSTTPRSADVRALLDERLEHWRTRAPGRAGDLRRRAAAGLPPLLVDPEWLRKVLDELVDNAAKHTPPGSSIVLVAARAPDAGRVRIGVRDGGPGIGAGEAERLFTSFEQRDGSATRRVGGLGLGLSFVRRVAEDAGWPLVVTSPVTGGRGTEVAVDVPAAAEPPAGVRRAASRAAPRPAPARGPARSRARRAPRQPPGA